MALASWLQLNVLSQNWADITELWPGGPQQPTHWEQIHSGIFLTAKRGTQNVAITGLGTIDGSGERRYF
jgi:hypothetical protein